MLITACCTVMFLLVMARMAGMVAAQRTAAITDALTGLRIRRYFEQSLATELVRATRNDQSVGLLILDVDHFKRVNDTYGHPGGDRVLIEIARRLAVAARPGTVVARYGGEEFILLMPQADPVGLTAAAERIRKAIGNTPVAVQPGTLLTVTVTVTVTVSVGACCFP